jgi:nucleotide-binding universal stress UspA family protein
MTILVAIDENERSEHAVEVAYDLATTYDDTCAALPARPATAKRRYASRSRSTSSNVVPSGTSTVSSSRPSPW